MAYRAPSVPKLSPPVVIVTWRLPVVLAEALRRRAFEENITLPSVAVKLLSEALEVAP